MEKTINTFASEKVVIKDLVISGERDILNGKKQNGKINFKTPDLEIYNVTAEEGCTIYNMFEGTQLYEEAFYAQKINLHDCIIDCPTLTHNILNVYTPASNANILIKDCSFSLNVSNSNIMRAANYSNADNVTITFENVNWTYENAGTASDSADWEWAGLLLFQPAGKDAALSGDLSHLKTWTINFINCKYNGEAVTSNNFGEHNQVLIAYNIGGTGAVQDLTTIEGPTINFN